MQPRAEVEVQFLAALRDNAMEATGDLALVEPREPRKSGEPIATHVLQGRSLFAQTLGAEWWSGAASLRAATAPGGATVDKWVNWDDSAAHMRTGPSSSATATNITVKSEQVDQVYGIVPATLQELAAADPAGTHPVLSLARDVLRLQGFIGDGSRTALDSAWEVGHQVIAALRSHGIVAPPLSGFLGFMAGEAADLQGHNGKAASDAAERRQFDALLSRIRASDFRDLVRAALSGASPRPTPAHLRGGSDLEYEPPKVTLRDGLALAVARSGLPVSPSNVRRRIMPIFQDALRDGSIRAEGRTFDVERWRWRGTEPLRREHFTNTEVLPRKMDFWRSATAGALYSPMFKSEEKEWDARDIYVWREDVERVFGTPPSGAVGLEPTDGVAEDRGASVPYEAKKVRLRDALRYVATLCGKRPAAVKADLLAALRDGSIRAEGLAGGVSWAQLGSEYWLQDPSWDTDSVSGSVHFALDVHVSRADLERIFAPRLTRAVTPRATAPAPTEAQPEPVTVPTPSASSRSHRAADELVGTDEHGARLPEQQHEPGVPSYAGTGRKPSSVRVWLEDEIRRRLNEGESCAKWGDEKAALRRRAALETMKLTRGVLQDCRTLWSDWRRARNLPVVPWKEDKGSQRD